MFVLGFAFATDTGFVVGFEKFCEQKFLKIHKSSFIFG